MLRRLLAPLARGRTVPVPPPSTGASAIPSTTAEASPSSSARESPKRSEWLPPPALNTPKFALTGGGYQRRGPRVAEPEKRLREAVCTGAFFGATPKKLNDVAQVVRGSTVEEARYQLRYCPRPVAEEVHEVLDRAVALAQRIHKLRPSELIVGRTWVGSRIIGKIRDIKAKGRSGTIHKRQSRVSVAVYEHPALVAGGFTTDSPRLARLVRRLKPKFV